MENKSPLSLLVVTQYFPPEVGAAPTRMDELTKRWAADGADVTVITSAPDYPDGELYEGYDNRWFQTEQRGDVTVVSTKTIPAASGGLPRRSLKFLCFMVLSIIAGFRVDSPDVVVSTSPQPLTGVTGVLVARLRRAKFVFEVRDLWPDSITELSDFDNQVLISSLEAIVSAVYRMADRIVIVVRGFEPRLVDSGVDPDKIRYHPNGIDVQYYDDGAPIEESSLLSDRFVVSYIGTIGRAHGLSVVLDAAEKLQNRGGSEDVLFLLVGSGAEREHLESEARRRGLDNVLFVGMKPKKMVPSYLNLTDASLVHLRSKDLFEAAVPSKMFEAMAARVPLILGVKGEALELLEDADAGVVMEPESSESLTECIKHLYSNEQGRREMGENGRQYVEQHRTWDRIASLYLCEIRSLLTD